MKRYVIARLFLFLLLIGQLGVAPFAHAYYLHPSVAPAAQGHAHHCPAPGDAAGAPTGGGHHLAPTGNPDCCTHSSCTCSCAGSLAFTVTPFGGTLIVADPAAVNGFAAPLILI